MEAYMQDDKDGGSRDARGQARVFWAGNVDGVPLGITATAALMAPNPSLNKYQPTNKRTTQRIGRKIAEAETVS